jgi:DNA-binding NtrC family response regulator
MRPVDGRPTDAFSRSRTVGVVIVDADPSQRRSLAGMIAERGEGRFIATVCSNSEEARAAVLARPGTIVLADLDTIGGASHLPDMGIGSTTIATSANVSLTTAIAAMKGGAIDFLPKPIGAKALIERLESAVAGWRLEAPAPSMPSAPLRGIGTNAGGL